MSDREVLNRALGCFADPTRRSSYFDLYAENVVLHRYVGVDPGLESVKKYYGALWSAFQDAKVNTADLVEQGDKIAMRFVFTGTHLGPFLNIAPTGKTVSVAGMTILKFNAADRCVERWSFTDRISMLSQLGVNPVY